MDDNTALILLRHLIERDQVGGTVDITDAEVRATEVDALGGRDWLLAYEWAAHGWVSDSVVMSDAFFAAMKDAGVFFFEPGLPPAKDDPAAQRGTPVKPSGPTQQTGTSGTGDDEEVDDGGGGDDEADMEDFEPDVPPSDVY